MSKDDVTFSVPENAWFWERQAKLRREYAERRAAMTPEQRAEQDRHEKARRDSLEKGID